VHLSLARMASADGLLFVPRQRDFNELHPRGSCFTPGSQSLPSRLSTKLLTANLQQKHDGDTRISMLKAIDDSCLRPASNVPLRVQWSDI
jgi:hypothetical protein